MHGLHLTADLAGCAGAPLLTDPALLRRVCTDAVAAAGLHAVAELFHAFAAAPQAGAAGVTGVVLLAESHLAVHTWPEIGAATLDVYVCNVGVDNSARARALLEALIAAFAPDAVERHAIERGSVGAAADAQATAAAPAPELAGALGRVDTTRAAPPSLPRAA
ncbi:adenosylmethionine decarboxylase [Piscinibacter koreensis]|uniref:Adenosylmethionine decarboxylase n=1 Tax=Piscinibacter koreensis TaxID=2742824 RepID=A0A7Y6NK54_9BURK|nr:adenosylmethionine decarboxylase [Schlegelella koreensis]NUZ04688.1 adenosylmethionine decarboxylase [Schlegelella koreensis]